MTTVGGLLTAYDEHMRGVQPKPPAGVRYERDGPLLRVAGGHRGYVCGPRDLGVTGAELGRLIARQRDYFAARGEAVGWPVRAHDQPAGLAAGLRAAGFVPGQTDTVLIGLAAEPWTMGAGRPRRGSFAPAAGLPVVLLIRTEVMPPS